MARYKVTVSEMKHRCSATDKDGKSENIWDVTGEFTEHVNASNKAIVEEKIEKKLRDSMKPGHYYVMDIVTDNKKTTAKRKV